MKFSNLKGWSTPRGNVTKLAIDGVTVWESGTRLGSIPVGSSVFMNLDGVRTEFIVVHQGMPDATLYDASCEGSWLLKKTLYTMRVFDSTDNDYENSNIPKTLNGTFLGLLDSDIQTMVKQVKIPYRKGTGSGGSWALGSDGLSTKIFLLSMREVGSTATYNKDGACLSYFEDTADTDPKRIAGEKNQYWWLRTPFITNTTNQYVVGGDGSLFGNSVTYSNYLRPAMILPSSAHIDENFNIIA